MDKDAIRKAAILISALDARTADALLEKMPAVRAQHVRNAVMQLQQVPAAEEEAVLADFLRSGSSVRAAEDPGIELDDSLAEKFARGVVDTAPDLTCVEDDSEPFRFLHEATIDSLGKHLATESPQLIAVVAAHLPPKRAADLIKRFDARLQADVLRRVAELDRTDPAILQDLEIQLKNLLADEMRVARNRSSGVAAVSSILMAAGTDRNEMLGAVSQYDRELVKWLREPRKDTNMRPAVPREPRGAPSVVSSTRDLDATPDHGAPAQTPAAMPQVAREVEAKGDSEAQPILGFSELVQLSDDDLSTLFESLPKDVLLLSLAGAPENFVSRLMNSLPPREAKALQRRIARVGPLRLTDIEQAQRRLGASAALLAAEGRIAQPGSSRFAAAA